MTGLVLGGGGVLGGAWELGALQALKEVTGWDARKAEHILGTSVGSLFGALLSAGLVPDMEVLRAAEHRSEGIPWPVPGSLDLGLLGLRERASRRWVMTVAGLLPRGTLSTRPIRETVQRCAPAGWPTERTLWVTACDYRTGERVVFGRSGSPECELAEAVAASCAIPGIYRPVDIGKRSFIDGGLYSGANLDVLLGTRLEMVICLNPMSSGSLMPRAGKVVNKLLLAAEQRAHHDLMSDALKLRASGMRVILIEPLAEDLEVMGVNLMNRKRSAVVYETAVKTVREQLRRLQMTGALDRVA
jgi:NTE family protein